MSLLSLYSGNLYIITMPCAVCGSPEGASENHVTDGDGKASTRAIHSQLNTIGQRIEYKRTGLTIKPRHIKS